MSERIYQRCLEFDNSLKPDSLLMTAWESRFPVFYPKYLQALALFDAENSQQIFVGKNSLELLISFTSGDMPIIGARIPNDIGSSSIVNVGDMTGSREWLHNLISEGIDHPFQKIVRDTLFQMPSTLYIPHNLYYIRRHMSYGGSVLVKHAGSEVNTNNNHSAISA
jgi:hypothetical protein